jgi:DNA-binding NarL/FixJ family response regulator
MLHNSIQVAMVDDHSLVRKALGYYLSQQEKIEIAFESSDVPDLTSKLKKHSIDILLMDLFMPKVNGGDALEAIRNEYPHIKIIILSMCTDISVVNTLLDFGIYGYISKSDDPEELVKAIKAVSDNRIYRNALLTEALYLHTQNNIKTNNREIQVNFDDREKKIIQMLWDEKNNKEIADMLFLSVRSIEKIRQDIKEKLGVKTTIGLLKYALAKRIIDVSKTAAIVNAYELKTVPIQVY